MSVSRSYQIGYFTMTGDGRYQQMPEENVQGAMAVTLLEDLLSKGWRIHTLVPMPFEAERAKQPRPGRIFVVLESDSD